MTFIQLGEKISENLTSVRVLLYVLNRDYDVRLRIKTSVLRKYVHTEMAEEGALNIPLHKENRKGELTGRLSTQKN